MKVEFSNIVQKHKFLLNDVKSDIALNPCDLVQSKPRF